MKVAALVGTVEHALRQKAQGVDLIVAQGTEAGGHTGEIGSLVLIPDVVDAVAPTPVLGAGGIASGRQAAAAMALGAQGVWTGSVWLTVAESETSPLVKQKLFAAGSRDAVRSRSLSGKPARLLRTAWTEAWERPTARARSRSLSSTWPAPTRRRASLTSRGAPGPAPTSWSECPSGRWSAGCTRSRRPPR